MGSTVVSRTATPVSVASKSPVSLKRAAWQGRTNLPHCLGSRLCARGCAPEVPPPDLNTSTNAERACDSPPVTIHRPAAWPRVRHGSTAVSVAGDALIMAESWTIADLPDELVPFEAEVRRAGLAEDSVRTYVGRSHIFGSSFVGSLPTSGSNVNGSSPRGYQRSASELGAAT
jgi:hypothetical protein